SLLFFNKEDHLLIFDTAQARQKAIEWLSAKTGVEILVCSQNQDQDDTGTATTILPSANLENEESVSVRLRQGLAGEIVAGLATAGCAPRAVIPQKKNLKQFFLELTRRQSGGEAK